MSNATYCARYRDKRHQEFLALKKSVDRLMAENQNLRKTVDRLLTENQDLRKSVDRSLASVDRSVDRKSKKNQPIRQSGGRARVEDESPSKSPIELEKKENSDSVASLDFERFWRVYPSRRPYPNPKAAAAKKFGVAVRHGVDPELLIAAAERYARLCRGKDPQYVVQTTRWFNEKRWEDEIQALRRSEPVHHYPIGMS